MAQVQQTEISKVGDTDENGLVEMKNNLLNTPDVDTRQIYSFDKFKRQNNSRNNQRKKYVFSLLAR